MIDLLVSLIDHIFKGRTIKENENRASDIFDQLKNKFNSRMLSAKFQMMTTLHCKDCTYLRNLEACKINRESLCCNASIYAGVTYSIKRGKVTIDCVDLYFDDDNVTKPEGSFFIQSNLYWERVYRGIMETYVDRMYCELVNRIRESLTGKRVS